ncbi:MAG: hypothetical protein IPH08_19295 [Rhodocyclaceae bacterium]|nr:hypothetical protein [Rhodocyclaceae bacterium]
MPVIETAVKGLSFEVKINPVIRQNRHFVVDVDCFAGIRSVPWKAGVRRPFFDHGGASLPGEIGKLYINAFELVGLGDHLFGKLALGVFF